MAYSKQQNETNKAYVKSHQKRIPLRYKNEDYEGRIRPAIEKSGLPTATFIKKAIDEKIERDGLLK